jgi:DNA polymerase III subunit delta'
MPVIAGTERHPHARAVLQGALDGAPSHAYLFHGPAGSGKRAVARSFAAALLSDGAADPENAAERVQHDVHPDLHWVRPSGWADMRVEDIKPVVSAAAHTPFESRRRVFVIERAEAMNDNAANRLLKTLEEPPSFAHLILLSDRLDRVMATIVSRCQLVRFAPPAVGEIAQQLQDEGVDEAAALACARLALGDGSRARRLALGDGPALRTAAESYARAFLAGESARLRPWTPVIDTAKAGAARETKDVEERVAAELEYLPAKDRRRVEREGGDEAKRAARRAQTAHLDDVVALAGLWLRDVACVLDGAPEVVHHCDRAEQVAADAQNRDVDRVRAAIVLCDEARAAWILNPTEELALEALAYRCERVLSVSG